MAKETIKVVQIDTDPATKSLKDLRNELKGFKDQMANLEEGSDAFLEIANKAGEVKHQIDEINESIKGASADFGDMVGNVTNVTAGIVGAFEAVAGGLQAMGVESEAVDETIARMQGLMAVVQGLSSIDDGIKAMDKLAASITSTSKAAQLLKAALQPKAFLAITAVITGLSLVFGKLGKNAKALADREKERAEAYKKLKMEEVQRQQEEYNTALERELLLKEKIIGVKFNGDDIRIETELIKLYTQEISALDAQLKNRYKDNEKLALRKEIRELEKDLEGLDTGSQQYIETLIEIAAAEDKMKKLKPLSDSEIADIETRIADLQGKIKDAEFRLKEAQILQKATDEAAAEAKAEAERIAKERLTSNIEHTATIIPLQIEPLPPANESLEDMGRRIGNIIAQAQTKAYHDKWVEDMNTITESGNLFFEQLKSTMDAFGDSSLGLSSGWIASLDQFQSAFLQTMDIVKSEGTVGWEAYGNVAATALGGIGTMLNALSQEQDVSTKEGFEQQKKLQISATVMNMLSGIMAAWTSSMALPAPASFIVGGIQTVATAALGAAQIAKIKSQTMNSAMASGAIQPSSSAINSTIIPPVQYSSAVQGASTEGAIKDTKVYVTETDIKNTMNKVDVQESENTY